MGPTGKDKKEIVERWIKISIQLTLVLAGLDLHRFSLAIFSATGRMRRVAVPHPVHSSSSTALGTLGPVFPGSPGTIHRNRTYIK